MRKSALLISTIYFLVQFAFVATSCKHDPFLDGVTPIDTLDTMIIDTVDTIDTVTFIPCDPDKVYFELDVLPILLSNCAFSGCHDVASHEEDVILTSYAQVISTAGVAPNNLNESDLYEVLVEDDLEKRMPFERPPLSQAQIQLIAKWIQQGAQNLECDPNAGVCDIVDVSFSQEIKPILQNHCQGCHSGTAPSGGIDLSSYNGVKSVASNGKLHGVTAWLPGFPKMPQGGSQLSDCDVDKIKAWVDAGAVNN